MLYAYWEGDCPGRRRLVPQPMRRKEVARRSDSHSRVAYHPPARPFAVASGESIAAFSGLCRLRAGLRLGVNAVRGRLPTPHSGRRAASRWLPVWAGGRVRWVDISRLPGGEPWSGRGMEGRGVINGRPRPTSELQAHAGLGGRGRPLRASEATWIEGFHSLTEPGPVGSLDPAGDDGGE